MVGQTIWCIVQGAQDMHKLKVEKLDSHYPPVYSCTWLNVWVIQHTLDIASIDFYSKIFNTNDIEPVGLESVPKTINLDFSLRVT